MPDHAAFLEVVRQNPVNLALLERLPELDLPQCHLTAGCLFQTVWNHRAGLPPTAMIKDYDVFYFDDVDMSWEGENAVIQRANELFSDLAVAVEFKNQARVHLWYEQKFGAPYPALKSARDGIDRYLIQCTCQGIEIATKSLYAPNGLEDTWAGILKINPLNPNHELFLRKAQDYRRRWPWLTIGV